MRLQGSNVCGSPKSQSDCGIPIRQPSLQASGMFALRVRKRESVPILHCHRIRRFAARKLVRGHTTCLLPPSLPCDPRLFKYAKPQVTVKPI